MSGMDLFEEVKRYKFRGGIEVVIQSGFEEESYKIGSDVIRILKPSEEVAEKKRVDGEDVFERRYSLEGELDDVLFKLLNNLRGCLRIEVSENRVLLKSIECPPCEPGAYTEIPDKYFLLDNGRVVEKVGEGKYKLYFCRLNKP